MLLQPAVGQAADGVGRRSGRNLQLGQVGRRLQRILEQRQLPLARLRRLVGARPHDPHVERGAADGHPALVLQVDVQSMAEAGDRRLGGAAVAAQGAADDQVVAGARHRDVLQPPALLGRGGVLRLPQLRVPERRAEPAVQRMHRLERNPPVGGDQHVGRAGAAGDAPGVGDDDDVELEPLGRMHRHQQHRLAALVGDRRLALPGRQIGLLLAELHEPLEIRPAHALELAGQPDQLADVRLAAVAVGLREQREVVVVVGDDPLQSCSSVRPAIAAASRV